MTHRVPADLAELRSGRRRLCRWLVEIGDVDKAQRDSVVLVFVELLTNAIEASGPIEQVAYSFSVTTTDLAVRVTNANPYGSSLELRSMPDPYAIDGRGLALVQVLATRVDIDSLGADVSISAYFQRPGRSAPSDRPPSRSKARRQRT